VFSAHAGTSTGHSRVAILHGWGPGPPIRVPEDALIRCTDSAGFYLQHVVREPGFYNSTENIFLSSRRSEKIRRVGCTISRAFRPCQATVSRQALPQDYEYKYSVPITRQLLIPLAASRLSSWRLRIPSCAKSQFPCATRNACVLHVRQATCTL
jgi:hypothetical protein